MRVIHIFLASANDMLKYRNCTEQVIDELNQSLAPHFNVRLELFRWEKNVTPQLGRPQQIIFEQADFEKIDIFIGILGNRFGTPTGAYGLDQQEYESGTQEEYDRACQSYHCCGRPDILIFKDNSPLKPGFFDIDQYSKVQDFLQEFEAGKSHPGLYSRFKSVNDFQSQLRIALTKNLLRLIDKEKNAGKTSETQLSPLYQEAGYLQLFTSKTNNLRGLSKNAAIARSQNIELLAKTGNSFLGSVGNRYLDLLIQNIDERNAQIRIILMNPWSMNAVLSAFAESASEQDYLDCLLCKKPAQDILTTYIQSSWYQMKLRDVLTNYGQLCKQYPNIQLRFVDVEIPASVLMTDQRCYFEPYANYCNTDRLQKKVSTFEVEMSNKSVLYQASKAYFNMLWENAISYETFISAEEQYKTALSNRLDSSYGKHIAYYIGAHALVRKDERLLLLQRSGTKAYMPGKWDIPGGSLEAGESPVATILREVKEETGITIRVKRIRYAYSNLAEMPLRQTIQVVYDAEYISGDITLNPQEHQDFKWVSMEELQQYDLINFVDEMIKSEAKQRT